jgi:endonuclease/exonuclease/phosphatase family metal-dependent hydrolase
MNIVSWNLLHRDGANVDQIERLIRRTHPDLLLLQEATDAIDALPARVGGHYVRFPLPGRGHGLAAWRPAPFAEHPRQALLQPGLFVERICQIVMMEGFAVANVHLSHGQIHNRRQLRRIARALPHRAAIIGDCNMVGPPMMAEFADVGPRVATHRSGGILPLRLDRCLVRGLRCAAAEALARAGSDHHPIRVELIVPSA